MGEGGKGGGKVGAEECKWGLSPEGEKRPASSPLGV